MRPHCPIHPFSNSHTAAQDGRRMCRTERKSRAGLEGFEPSTAGLRVRCSTWLSHRPAVAVGRRGIINAKAPKRIAAAGLRTPTAETVPSLIVHAVRFSFLAFGTIWAAAASRRASARARASPGALLPWHKCRARGPVLVVVGNPDLACLGGFAHAFFSASRAQWHSWPVHAGEITLFRKLPPQGVHRPLAGDLGRPAAQRARAGSRQACRYLLRPRTGPACRTKPAAAGDAGRPLRPRIWHRHAGPSCGGHAGAIRDRAKPPPAGRRRPTGSRYPPPLPPRHKRVVRRVHDDQAIAAHFQAQACAGQRHGMSRCFCPDALHSARCLHGAGCRTALQGAAIGSTPQRGVPAQAALPMAASASPAMGGPPEPRRRIAKRFRAQPPATRPFPESAARRGVAGTTVPIGAARAASARSARRGPRRTCRVSS